MSGEVLKVLISGMLVSFYAVIATFFLRFYRETRDRLFVMFSAAFLLLAVQRAGLLFSTGESTWNTLLYTLRFVAFAIILYAILDKNRR